MEEADYMGAEFRSMCHADKYATWLETPHVDVAGIEVANERGTWYYAAVDASGGLHNPERSYAMLGCTSQLASEVEATALETNAAAFSGDVSSL